MTLVVDLNIEDFKRFLIRDKTFFYIESDELIWFIKYFEGVVYRSLFAKSSDETDNVLFKSKYLGEHALRVESAIVDGVKIFSDGSVVEVSDVEEPVKNVDGVSSVDGVEMERDVVSSGLNNVGVERGK